MFLSLEVIKQALEELKTCPPFYGVTFLVLKKEGFLAATDELVEAEKKFIKKYYRPNKKNQKIYNVFEGKWASQKSNPYGWGIVDLAGFVWSGPGGGSWAPTYLDRIVLQFEKKIPVFYLAVWLFREIEFPPETTGEDIIRHFLDEFHITKEEQEKLCDLSVPSRINGPLLQKKMVEWEGLKPIIGFADGQVSGGSLVFLELTGIGPARKLTIEPAPRLNLITGDNGLGKSFLLDCAWWALTKQWTGQPAMPRPNADKPQIEFEIGAEGRPGGRVRVGYDWEGAQDEKWKPPQKLPVVPGLSIYFRVDGSIAIFDPARRHLGTARQKNDVPVPFLFSKTDVWDGWEREINGLVRDWVLWQFSPDQESFAILSKVLQRLSPPEAGDLGQLEPGSPIRMAGDSRDIPTLNHPYGTVPIVHASAGVQRIITLAYLLVWVWREHRINSQAIRKNPEDQLVLLIDELESHLHPQWQRSLLPALLTVCEELSRELSIQLLIATHSPFVVASVEPDFDPEQDKLFHIDLVKTDVSGKEAEIREVDFVRYGRIGSWLTSEVFNLRQDYGPIEAEKAIEAARSLQQQETPDPQEIKTVTTDLARYLSDLDVFWPRWVKFAEKHGVEI